MEWMFVAGPFVGVLLGLLGWFLTRLVTRNDEAHQAMREDITELKTGQAAIKGKLDILIKNGGHDG